MSTLRKHSLEIAGHHTSVTLEDAFWTELKKIAKTKGTSLNALVAEIDEAREGNLSSAIRVFVLETVLEEQ
jgi:predicted DNA-binding ribbon-helix-helix protein